MSRYILILLATFAVLTITIEGSRLCPLNEEWNECGTACPLTCEDPEPRECTLQCVKGCQCKPGWVRSKLGLCVPKKWCRAPETNRCPLNEEWNDCGTACPLTCENPEPSNCTLQCVKGCQCKPGWVRSKLGLCIPEKLCRAPETNRCPLNEEWNDCGTACPLTCENPEPTVCTKQCVKGCQCKPGLVRNKLGQCVPEKLCPPETNRCPLNEEWSDCGTACPLTCENPEPTVCTLQCVRGCQCKPGWVRSKLGLCVPEKLCPPEPNRCPLNEEWSDCGTACPLTCENPEPSNCTLQCVRGCQCKPGWVRSKLGLCVPEKLCPPETNRCPLNEEWNDCGTACPLTCENPEPRVCTLQCVKGCQCKPGLVRNKLGQCVPEKLCPPETNRCPLNEEWSDCGTACPLTCENPELTVCTLQCVRGCQCKPGWVRSKLGLCVPEKLCPPEPNRCPLNEEWKDCGTACPLTCENPEPTVCTKQCVRGCQCKPGWVRSKLGLCVPEKLCPPEPNRCPLNEEWNECGTACPLTCENPGPTVCTLQCVKGCQCKPGLLRNKFGQCVPKKWCCS